MMKIIIQKALAVVAGATLLLGCEKKVVEVVAFEEAGMEGNFAHIRFVHASPNLATIAGTTTEAVDIRVGNQKINGAALAYGGLWPNNFPTTYAAVAPGQQDIKVSLRGTTNFDSIALVTLNANLEQGKYYSFIVSDNVVAAANDSARIFVEDNFVTPAEGRVVLRFANVLNDTAADKRVNVFSFRRNANLFTAVDANSITAFSNQPFINIPDTLVIRRTSDPTVELARINTITYSNRRVYTIYARGNTAMATGAKARGLVWYTHR